MWRRDTYFDSSSWLSGMRGKDTGTGGRERQTEMELIYRYLFVMPVRQTKGITNLVGFYKIIIDSTLVARAISFSLLICLQRKTVKHAQSMLDIVWMAAVMSGVSSYLIEGCWKGTLRACWMYCSLLATSGTRWSVTSSFTNSPLSDVCHIWWGISALGASLAGAAMVSGS